MIGRFKIAILNDKSSREGLGTYASLLYEAVSDVAELYSTSWDPAKNDREFPGTVFRNEILNRIPNNRFGTYGSRLLTRYLFKDIYGDLRKFKRNGGVIHYASQLVHPVDHSLDDIVSIHDILGTRQFLREPFHFAFVQHYLKFNNILTISSYVKEQIQNINPSARPVVIYPSVSRSFYKIDKESSRKKIGLPLDKKIILNISSSQHRKNISTVVKVMERLTQDYLLIHVGEDIGCGLSFFNVSYEQLNLLYNSADVLLFPTLAEGFGRPLVEAMAVGLPIVSSDIPVVREITQGAAVLTDPLEVDAIVKGIKELTANSNFLAEKEMERAKFFSRERFRADLLRYYHKIGALQ